ncbi:MAG: leucine-rich repeat protein [Clostridia bacterium]|nr:leucine-rich repeat protein [Clostridia bacterium]
MDSKSLGILELNPAEKADGVLRGRHPFRHPYLEIPEGITAIDKDAFQGNTRLIIVRFPATLRHIDARAFAGCNRLREIHGGSHLQTIGDEAFAGCRSLTDALLPPGLLALGRHAYADCTDLAQADVPDSVEDFGEQPFYRCTALKSLKLPARLTDASPGAEAAAGIPDKNGFLLHNGVLDSYYGSRRRIVIPESVLDIKAKAFDMKELPAGRVEIRLPDGLRRLHRSQALLDPRVEINLPVGYLRQPRFLPAEATAELMEGAWSRQILAADLISLYLFQKDALCGKAAVLLEERDPYQMAVLMKRRLDEKDVPRARRRPALERMAQFCLAHAEVLPEGWEKEFFQADQPPAKLVLAAEGIDPESPLFLQVRARSLDEPAEKESVLTAIGGYLAVGHHCERTGRLPSALRAAEEAASLFEVGTLPPVLEQLFPQAGCARNIAQAYPYLRFGTGSQAEIYLTHIMGPAGVRRETRRHRPDLRLLGPLMLSPAGETLLEMVRTEAAYPDAGVLEAYLRAVTTLQEACPLCFPEPLGLDAAGSKTYTDDSGRPVLQFFYSEGSFALRDLTTGRWRKALPSMPGATEQRMRISQDMAAIQNYYADVIAWIHRREMAGFLLGDSMTPAMWLAVYRDPFLAGEGRGIVWEQDGRTFVWDGGYARSPRGRRLQLKKDTAIRPAHPLTMTPEEISAWKTWFSDRPMQDRFDQLNEPVYTAVELRPDRYAGCSIEAWDLQKAEPQLGFEQSLRERRKALGIGSQGSLEVSVPSSTRGSAKLVLGTLHVSEIDRAANHALYLLDLWTLKERIRRDDLSTLKLLAGMPAAKLRPYLDLALEAGAPQLTAALLQEAKVPAPRADEEEFTLDS